MVSDKLTSEPPCNAESDAINRKYRYWRLHVFIGIYVGYTAFYITRKSLTYITPVLIQDLGLDKTDIGLIGTLFYFTYGTSKFISGIISDRSNPRYFMAAGLFLTGVINILFGLSTSFWAFASLWTVNAFFQGWGWPPCSKILANWFSRTERGFWWGLWNTAHNLGGAIAPVALSFFVVTLGWQFGMYAAGIFALVVSLILLVELRDIPSRMGLPSVGRWRNDQLEIAHEQEGKGLPLKAIFFKYVISNRYLWLLALCYILVYVVRIAISDWGNLYLTEVHNCSLTRANSALSVLEIGGFMGCLVAGWGSDWWFGGNRTPMNTIFSIGVLLSVAGLWLIPVSGYFVQLMLFFLIGFFVYGPQMLIGMAAVEYSHKEAAGAASGFVSLFAYFGAAMAGLPLAFVMESFGWDGFFITLSTCSFLILMILLPLLRSEKASIREGFDQKKLR
ncbi:MFS transporter family glucose-6-phosphate receptor UhpC [Endozoicomonas montiporae]|nr:MFS transporter family glucose-6-phosphate receptor UhpC [Endozoicomonas montiporae]